MVYVRNLPDTVLEPEKADLFLYCSECMQEYSADRADYFFLPPDEPMYCGHDGEELVLCYRNVPLLESIVA